MHARLYGPPLLLVAQNNSSTHGAIERLQATEPIVDLALAAGKPFAVVPCCIFPSQNQHRRTPSGAVVTTLPEFVAYLVAKSPSSICESQLDSIPGCNKIVWSGNGTTPAIADSSEPALVPKAPIECAI